eukprot:2878-Pleurochrysis_carterae.AAC.1
MPGLLSASSQAAIAKRTIKSTGETKKVQRGHESHGASAHQSTALLCPLLCIISGARYSGVPTRVLRAKVAR